MITANSTPWIVFHSAPGNDPTEAVTILGQILCVSRNPYVGVARVLIEQGHPNGMMVQPFWVEHKLNKRGYRKTIFRDYGPMTLADLARWPVKEKLGRVLPFRKVRQRRSAVEGRQA